MAQLTLLPTTVITAPLTNQVGPVFETGDHEEAIFEAVFTYGSGGTTAKAWIQTSVDGGATWFDVANFAFAQISATRISEVQGQTVSAAAYVPTDGTLADNTVKDGMLGRLYRYKLTTTGTYAGGTALALFAKTR
jgi:Neuraminidase (sialidase)